MNFESILIGFAAGLALGVVYLLALWYTVRRVARTGKQSILLVSFVTRIGVLLLGFYTLIGYGAQGLVAALLGFMAARVVITRVLGRRAPRPAAAADGLPPEDADLTGEGAPPTDSPREEQTG